MGARSTTFTTYVNMEEAKGVDRALSSLESKANSTFARIASQAAKASTLSNGTGGAGQSPQSIQALAGAERQRAVAIQATVSAQNAARASSARLTSQHMLESNAARAASKETSNLERSLRLAAVAATVAQGPLGPIAGRLSAIATAVRELAGVRLGLVGVGAGLGAFVHYASAAQDLKSKLYPLFDSQQQVNAAFKETIRIADSAKSAVEPIVDLYAKLTRSGKDFGISKPVISRVVEQTAKLARLSGGDTQSQAAGIYQFSQALGKGKLNGDEFVSLSENIPEVLRTIAKGFEGVNGKIGVTYGELPKLAKAGELTTKKIVEALLRMQDQTDKTFDKLPNTISASINKLSNSFTALINGTDDAYGTTRAFAAGLGFLADNLGRVTSGAFQLLTVYAAIRGVDMARKTYEDVAAWNAKRDALQTAARKTLETSSAERAAAAQNIVSLRAERAEIQAQIPALQQQAEAARQARNELTAKTTGKNYGGRSLDLLALPGITNEATLATQRLDDAQARLRTTSAGLHQNLGQLTTSTVAFKSAAAAASKSSNVFASAGKALWGVIGPNLLGLALGVGISLLIEFATREDAAAGAADRMAASQATLAKFVDFTTGKIREQNAALLLNEASELRKTAKESRKNWEAKRQEIGDQANAVYATNRAIYTEDPRIKAIISDYTNHPNDLRYGAASTSARLEGLAKSDPTLRGKVTTYQGKLAQATNLAQENVSAEAGAQYLSGNQTKENLRLMQGNFTGRDVVDTPISAGAADEKLDKKRKGRAKSTDEAAKAERELQRVQERTDKRTDIVSKYEDQPKAITKALKDARELNELVDKPINDSRYITEKNPLGQGLYTQEMADADAARIQYGVRKPIRDAIDEQQRGLDISQLRLEGYDAEATALEKALQLQDQIGEVSRADLETLIANETAQRKINDALASRERQVAGILDAANQTRDAFESMLVGLARDPANALKNFGNTILNNVMQIQARQLTERLFAGADEKLRQLVTGSNGVDRAAEILKANVNTAANTLPPLAKAASSTATALEAAAGRINAAANSIVGGDTGLAPSGTLAAVAAGDTTTSLQKAFDATFGQGKASNIAQIVGAVAGSASGVSTITGAISALQTASTGSGNGSGAPETQAGPGDFIVVTGQKPKTPANDNQPAPPPTGTTAYEKVFSTLGEKLDKTFKSGTFFKGIGKGVGQALSGAGEGMMASGVLSALGIEQSSTGAAIGGAIGSFIPIPGGSIIGGMIGGTLGALFGETKTGSASLGQNAYGLAGVVGTGGNNAETKKVISGLGGSVSDQLNQIADSLGGTIGAFNVAIGKRKNEYRVSGTGNQSSTTSKKGNSSDIVYKGTDEAGAIAAAVQNALEDGAITGITEASKNILKSGQNLQTALTKATAIESIGKRLLAKTNPMKYAVEQVNQEFTKLIAYLKEGGASAAQFADAQKLYDLDRADAIKQATQQSVAALQQYMDEMKGGNSSPFNKLTVYENAAAKLAAFRGDIAAGKVVDQHELLNASKNFQDASQKLYGSSESFFQDFNDLFALLAKAKDNALGTGNTDLPGSPFATADMSTYLTQLNQTTSDQTLVLGAKLDAILAAMQAGGYNYDYVNNNVLGLLPGVAA